jgi:poly-beta-1,6-N-acetyl-D-glucosamine biosynthesis protein PgaD
MEQSRQRDYGKRGDLIVETKVSKVRRLFEILATTFLWLLILLFMDFVIVSVIYHFRHFVPEYFHVIHLQIGWFGMSLGTFGAILLYIFFFFWVNARMNNRKKTEEVNPVSSEELAEFFDLSKEEVQERRGQKLTVIKSYQNVDSKQNE